MRYKSITWYNLVFIHTLFDKNIAQPKWFIFIFSPPCRFQIYIFDSSFFNFVSTHIDTSSIRLMNVKFTFIQKNYISTDLCFLRQINSFAKCNRFLLFVSLINGFLRGQLDRESRSVSAANFGALNIEGSWGLFVKFLYYL